MVLVVELRHPVIIMKVDHMVVQDFGLMEVKVLEFNINVIVVKAAVMDLDLVKERILVSLRLHALNIFTILQELHLNYGY